ncbi:MAG TPA: DUF2309 domain-containing protein [Bryobacteraceae bacterium]|nr:DUF2309 domain-containing protein [Bryobacteraceae bacterium]
MTTTAPSIPLQHEDRRRRIHHAVEHAAHLVPAQGPIGVFIHHNTLHAFQNLPFEKAVCEASELYRTEPFLKEDAYRDHLREKRIRIEDIEAVLDRESTEPILPGRLDRRTLRKKLLVVGQRRFEPATIQWQMEETDLLRIPRAGAAPAELQELFKVCQGLVEVPQCTPCPALRPRDVLLAARGIDLDEVVHPILIRLCGAFLDQGMAYWPMPNREQGFLKCVRSLLSQGPVVFPEYLQNLGKEFRQQAEAALEADGVVLSMLERFGVSEADWDRTIQAELLALPGWAGMMYRLEVEPELAPHVPVPCSLMDYLAVRLTMEAVATARIMGTRGLSGLMRSPTLAERPAQLAGEQLAIAASLFDAFQILGLTSADINALGSILRQRLVDELVSFDDLERRRILHLAYELRHELDVLGPLARYRQEKPPVPRASRPRAQVFFCIDEREESMRRNLEEIAPDVETLSAAGFYGVAMDYAGIDDAHGVPLCPVVVKPQHAVRERALDEHEHIREVRRRRRKLMARTARATFVSSRTLLRGWASTAGLGLLSLFPLAVRVLAPRSYGRLWRTIQDRLIPRPATELNFIRSSAQACVPDEKLFQGFTTAEKIARVAGVLGPAGLRENFARLVVMLGHGSTSLNNPHESAHDCGACGGRRGGPNGRIFAAMANRPEVREGLAERGIHIPDDTWFVGGYHDTCNDEVDLYDVECVPECHREELDRVRHSLNRARALDALERARRFEAARWDVGPDEALRHVQERAEHLAEPRPEYGHATNAVCIVGRREVTRGLFLDRRAFLISYDAELDPKDEGLAQLLGAAVPVCAGISLEYYFSYVDNEGYGCGTKLPHNITGLLGVMNGHASDLRTGLPLQMVEVHEPVRILFVVESTPERVMEVISANPGLSELVENRWVRLAILDPDTGEVQVKRGTGFEPLRESTDPLPSVPASPEWFRGKLHHLPIARIMGHLQA